MIRAVELRDFMSYEEASVPLRPGLNLVCGPNGSGKSSILVGISLVLGQAQTERSRRLADLIRWGKPEARVSLVLDNETEDGHRLFPHRREDRVTVTRVLKTSGSYFYLVGDQPVTKTEVREAFDRLKIFPDNMLIIMQQLMVHRFASVAPAEKLRMFEEAVDLRGYREDVLQALEKLRGAGEEAKTLRAVLESTEQSYEFWRREFEKYLRKKALEARVQALDAEAAWARVVSGEAAVARLRNRLEASRTELSDLERQVSEADRRTESAESAWAALRAERGRLETERLNLTRVEASTAAVADWTNEWREALGGELPQSLGEARERARRQAEEAATVLQEVNARLAELERGFDAGLSGVVDGRVDSKVLRFRAKWIADEIRKVESQLRTELDEVQSLTLEAERLGARIAPRKVGEIQAEASAVKQEMAPLAHLSDEVEKVYTQHLESYETLRARAEALAEHRKGLEAELAQRSDRWQEVVEALLVEVSRDFDALLRMADGTGRVRLANPTNIEKAGLEILAGFRGQDAIPIETFAQSGGERSLAMTAFLLALQRRLTSPFRAIDEFDVHLDPHNRDLASKMILASTADLPGVQYLAITPGPVTPPEEVALIVVQNVSGASEIGRKA